jgi:lipopolysaccharide/colanic/teichoic acid biosynthesis glycosyltransferase
MTSPPLVARGELSEPTTWNIERATARTSWSVGKRAFDVAFALILLAATAPVLLLVAVLIKIDSRGPVFYRVRRVGYQGRPLMMLKFRKMHEHATGGPLTAADDPRLTRIGQLLTRTRLDELPQLWDVLRGRMSIIGPRPEDPRFVGLHPAQYAIILSIRPGITGLAQLAYVEERRIVDDVSPVDDYIMRIMPQKLTLDKLYARHSSLKLDLTIVRWTMITLLLGRPVSVSRTTAVMRARHRRRASDTASTNGRTNGTPPPRSHTAEAMQTDAASASRPLQSSDGVSK